MNNKILINILRLIILVVIQVMVLNRINLGGYLNPYLYIMFILLLPFETPKWLLLLASFGIGITVDAFSGSYAIHAFAATFMGFMRPVVLRMITSKKEYEPGLRPGIQDLGFNWFLNYSVLLVLFHHLALYFIENFSFADFFLTIWRIILNTILTVAVIFLTQYLFFTSKQQTT